MGNRDEHAQLSGDDLVVTYARVPPITTPGYDDDDDPAGPTLTGVEVPFVERPRRRGAPEVYVPPDLVDAKRRRRLPRVAVLVGAVAIVAGIGALAAAYNAAVNLPIDRSATASAPAPGAADVESAAGTVTVVAKQPATVDDGATDATLAPRAVRSAVATVPPAGNDFASAPPVGEAQANPPPAPRERPDAGAPQEARTEPDQPSAAGDIDALMAEVDEIIATSKSDEGSAADYPPLPPGSIPMALPSENVGLSGVPGQGAYPAETSSAAPPPLVVTPPQEPVVITPPATVAEAPPSPWTEQPPPRRWWQIGPLRQRFKREPPQPPAEIPQAQPQTPGWW